VRGVSIDIIVYILVYLYVLAMMVIWTIWVIFELDTASTSTLIINHTYRHMLMPVLASKSILNHEIRYRS
jgi:hypothetical protein